jgi:DNA-binding transcriptional MerR regulator
MKKINEYLKIKDAAAVVGVSPSTLRNWEVLGRLKSHKNPHNSYRLYNRQDLDNLLIEINKSVKWKEEARSSVDSHVESIMSSIEKFNKEKGEETERFIYEMNIDDRQDTIVAIYDTVEMLNKGCSKAEMFEALRHIQELTEEYVVS